jgi:hypothetical protein
MCWVVGKIMCELTHPRHKVEVSRKELSLWPAEEQKRKRVAKN